MVLPLVPPNDPALRAKAAWVADPASLSKLAHDLIETMKTEGGVGLAAPQVGQRLRVFVTGVGDETRIFINPKIVKRSDEQIWWEEGCLSLPRLLGPVKRPKQVTVTAVGLDGKSFRVTADDLLGRVLQHEIDHLDGVLFPDRMEDLTKLRKLTEEEWQSRFDAKKDGESMGGEIE
jgi:peptide deformylase